MLPRLCLHPFLDAHPPAQYDEPMKKHMQRRLAAFFAALLLIPAAGNASTPAITACPDTFRPGKPLEIAVTLPAESELTLLLSPGSGGDPITLAGGQPFPAGQNTLCWSGLLPFGETIPAGPYTLQVESATGESARKAVTVGSPYPILSALSQNVTTLGAGGVLDVAVTCSESGTLRAAVVDVASGEELHAFTLGVSQGETTVSWDGSLAAGERPAPGEYALVLTLQNAAGDQSEPAHAAVMVDPRDHALIAFDALTAAVHGTYSGGTSPVYGSRPDDSFWSLTPGETDDARIWEVLTQPIIVYDDSSITPTGHVYLSENPDGTGIRMAQIHGLSQGLHVIGEENEYGYVLVEAFSNYDPDFTPLTPEERFGAFDVFRGYIPARHLKTVPVNQRYALLIDKKTQRMYLFENGRRVSEFTISTGLIYDARYYYETIPGEFITIGHGSGYQSWDTFSDYPIRFNGGTMLHEVTHTIDAGGGKYYGIYEARLGQKHSSGCVRVPYKPNAEGYNMAWLWKNLKNGTPYKIIIWDDLGRLDTPTTWR